MIKGKRLVPLAVLSDKPITLEGFGEIAPTTKWLPEHARADELLRHLGRARARPTTSSRP